MHSTTTARIPNPKAATRRHGPVRFLSSLAAMVLLLSGFAGLVQLVTAGVAAAAAPTITGPGYGEYNGSTALATTITAASNNAALPQGTINVASTAGFPTTNDGFTVQTTTGYTTVFCTGTDTATTFTTCTGGTGTLATGNYLASVAASQFNVYTLISGGAASVDPTSLTVVTDVPSADRGGASLVTANATDGLITYMQSKTPTGTFSLTFGICAAGTATYSSSNANCTTGTINYSPGVSQDLGDAVSVLGGLVTADIYEPLSLAVTVPTSVEVGQTATAYVAPAPTLVPGAETADSITVTVTDVAGITAIAPVPAGTTVQSMSLIGGDASTTSATTLKLCTATGTGCTASAATGNYADTTFPYIELQLPTSVSIPGGDAVTIPTIEVTLKANTGAAGTVAHATITEFVLDLTLSIGNVVFDGYPTTGSSGTPPVAPATALSSTSITAIPQTVSFTSTAPTTAQVGGTTYTPTATASSGLTPTITVDATSSSVCSISSGVVSYQAAGTCTLDANQAGNTTYGVAPQVQQSFSVAAAPTITSVSPSSGSTAGGTSVTITGTNLGSATAVDFGASAASVTSDSATQIVATTPAGTAGLVNVSVTSPGGATATDAGAFTYTAPAPTITSVSPASGTTAGGTSVTITGTNLGSATAVKFGANAATVTADTATSITATTPAGAAGSVNVSVTTSGGTAIDDGAFTYVTPTPTITGVSPASGSTLGGTPVTITGTNLSGATAVDFGGVAGTVGTNTATSITVTTPAGTAGAVNVSVTTPGGTATDDGAFTYVTPAPTITTVSPSSGSTDGGTAVTVTGTNLSGASAVDFGGAPGTVTADSATSITVTTPAGTAGAVNVSVTTPGGTATDDGAFTYVTPAPTITGISPPSGTTAGGTSVTITGTDLGGATAVDFGGVAGTVTADTATSISVTTPAGSAGAVNVSVTTPGGTTTDDGAFTYITVVPPPPTITAVSPSSGSTDGGTVVTITGTNLGSAAVDFGANPGTVTADSASSITVTTPAGSAGAVNVSATTAGGTATDDGAFTYQTPAPVITSVAPDSGSTDGGTAVTITGTDLGGASAVDFGGVAGTVTADSATSISVTTPGGAAGAVDVSVTTPGGTATDDGAFTYVTPAPVVDTVSPSQGSTDGGTAVTITGTDLGGATAVDFGGVAGTVTADTATSISVTTPAGSAGTVDVSVTTAGGTATDDNAFTYVIPPPVITSVAPDSGSTDGGTAVTITGTDLGGATAVDFGGVAGTVTADTATSISVTTPAGSAGTVDVSVTTAGGTDDDATAFTYVTPPPAITGVSPASGTTDGGTAVTVTGTDLGGATAVDFGGSAGTVTADTATSISVTTPSGTAGLVNVSVTTGGGTTTDDNAYTYVAPMPTITSIAPASGPTTGGTVVTITGTGLVGATAVGFGPNNGTVSADTSTSITVTTPAGTAGAVNVTVTTAGGTATDSAAFTYVAPAGGTYVPLSPTRICDTRAGNPSNLSGLAETQCLGKTLSSGTALAITAGDGNFSVPADATAVVVNVTAVNESARGYLTVYPDGDSAPTASNLNFPAQTAVPNLVEVGLSAAGKIDLISNVSTDVAVDLEGYVAPSAGTAGLYDPLSSPARICDTRPGDPSGLTGGDNQCNGMTLSSGHPLTVQVTGNGGVPVAADVSAVVLNVTATGPTAKGYLTAYPASNGTPPTASNLNFSPGQTVPNRVIVPVSASGQVDLVSNVATNAIVDVSGWYTTTGGSGSTFTPAAAPVRICDTRAGNPSGLGGGSSGAEQCNGGASNPGSPLGTGGTKVIQVTGTALDGVPADATAVVLNVTAIDPSAQTHLTVYPGGTTPNVSDLNPAPGSVEANLVVATVGAGGTITIYNFTGSVNLAVDVAGWYTAGS